MKQKLKVNDVVVFEWNGEMVIGIIFSSGWRRDVEGYSLISTGEYGMSAIYNHNLTKIGKL